MRKTRVKSQKPLLTREMLRKESFYLKLKLLNRARIRDTRLRASKRLAEMVVDLSRNAYKKKKPVVLTSLWSPSEIFYALDIIPINPESVAANLANFGLADEYLGIAEKHFHPPETCSVLRCAAGAAIEKLFPQPAAVVATTHLCDAGAKMSSMASRIYGCQYFLIDMPQERGEEAVSHVAQQLEEMAYGLSDIVGKKLDKEKLSRAIELSNKARTYAIQANEMRQAVPTPMRGSEALGYLYLIGLGFGAKQTLAIYRTMAQELRKRVAKKFTPIEEEKYRLLWLHIKPYFRNNLFRYLERERKAAIVFDEINYIFWPELDPQRPFYSVAQRLVSNLLNGSMDDYLEILLRLAEQYKIDGVVHYAHWGCRWNYGRLKIVKEAFQEKGIPIISIDCDSASERNYFEGQIRNQIDSFLDMIT